MLGTKPNLLYKRSVGWAFLLPALLVLATIRLYPLLDGIFLSVTDANMLRLKNILFVGANNFVEIFTEDKEFYSILLFTFVYTFSVVALSYVAGLFLALLLNADIKFRGLFRVLVLIPWVIPPAVAANNWLMLLNDQFGFINAVLLQTGIIHKPILFVATEGMARLTVIAFGVWKSLPFMMIVLLAGLQAIPKDMYEAAIMDGSKPIRTLFTITLPMLSGVTIVSTLLMTMWTYNNFENVYLLTQGGPVNGTNVFSIYSYIIAFFRMRLGYSSAVSVVMMVALVALSVYSVRKNKAIT